MTNLSTNLSVQANLDVIYPPPQPINAVLQLPHVALHQVLVLRQALLHALHRTLQFLQRRPRPPLLLLQALNRLLEPRSGRVQRRQRTQAREDMWNVREQWREARQDRGELLLQSSVRRVRYRRAGGGRSDGWGGGCSGAVRAAPLGAVVRLAAGRA